jgi:phosphoglycolate phosphatase
MNRRQPFRLVVFDWDGTLMDSAASIVGCMEQSLLDLGLPVPPEEERRATIGLGLNDVLERLCPNQGREVHQRVVERYRHHWFATYRHRSVPFPGAVETVRALGNGDRFLAVATGKGRQGLDYELRETGLRELFLTTRTVNESPPKPSPEMLLEITDELGVRPEETLMVGDTTFDLEMAHHAGAPSVGVLSGSHSREELERWRPLTCLPSVVDLPGWLADGST